MNVPQASQGQGSERDDFIRWELLSRDCLDVKRCYIFLAGDLVAGVLLSQIIYWFLPKKGGGEKLTIERNGELWLAKSRESWWGECCITPRQVDRCLIELEKRGLVETGVFRFGGLATKHVRLNFAELKRQLWELSEANTGINQKGKPELRKGENRNLPLGDSGFHLSSIPSITETTAKTTAKSHTPNPFPKSERGRGNDASIESVAECEGMCDGAAAVCRAGGFIGKRMRRVIEDVIRAELPTPAMETAQSLIDAWKQYQHQDNLGLFRFTWGPPKFFNQGHWRSDSAWPFDQERLRRHKEARVGMP
jgi:hypothetical protein